MRSHHLSHLTVAAFACALVLPLTACETQREEFVETPEAQEQIPVDTITPGAQPAPAPLPPPGTSPDMDTDTGTRDDSDTMPELDTSLEPRP